MYSMSLLHLLHLCDSALPIGGFSHSAGLETYVQEGMITGKETAKEFVVEQLSENIFNTDAALVSLAYDAACNNDIQMILQLDETCTAVKLPREVRLASNKLGIRLLKIFQHNEAFIIVNKYKANIRSQQAFGHYCIAFGLFAHALNIDKQIALTAFYYNAATGFITNAVKLIPLGQQDGQEILMSLFPLIDELVRQSLSPNKEMIGYCCAGFDIRCMQHEQLYSRLYMS
jgi:urease accessory protein